MLTSIELVEEALLLELEGLLAGACSIPALFSTLITCSLLAAFCSEALSSPALSLFGVFSLGCPLLGVTSALSSSSVFGGFFDGVVLSSEQSTASPFSGAAALFVLLFLLLDLVVDFFFRFTGVDFALVEAPLPSLSFVLASPSYNKFNELNRIMQQTTLMESRSFRFRNESPFFLRQ